MNNIKNKTKIVSGKLLEVSTMLKHVPIRGETSREVMKIAAIYSEIDLTFLDLPSLDHLSQLPKISDCAIFFEALAEETKKLV